MMMVHEREKDRESLQTLWRRHAIVRTYIGMACWWSAGLVIERLRVRIPAGAAGEFSSPELTLCADSCAVSVPPPCYRSGT